MKEPSHLGGDSKGMSESETQIYPGSAPREEVKAYVLVCAVLMMIRLQRGRNSPDLALDDFEPALSFPGSHLYIQVEPLGFTRVLAITQVMILSISKSPCFPRLEASLAAYPLHRF